MTDGLIGRRLKDGRGVTHLVRVEAKNRSAGGVDVRTACGLEFNVIPKIGLRKRGDVDCMSCLVGFR